MLFPYRNDLRKVLLPYLDNLKEENWYKRSEVYPNNVAWIISHIAQSEDFWVNEVGLKQKRILDSETTGDPGMARQRTPSELIDDYKRIREYTDKVLAELSTEELDAVIEVPTFSDGWEPPSIPTWLWLFHHVYTHEAYHIGQIGVIARINGFSGPLF